jgi:hypothetical protein
VLELTDQVVGPMLGDVDGDGRRDLLAGQHRGKLRVFRDLELEGTPAFREPVQAG